VGESRLLWDFKDGNLQKAVVMRGNYSEMGTVEHHEVERSTEEKRQD